MSLKVTNQVWLSALPRDEKFVALCLADFSSDDGEGIYPSIDYIVWKTGYSRTQTKKILHTLQDKGVIDIEEKKSKYGTNQYRIILDKIPGRGPFRSTDNGRSETDLPKKGGSKTDLQTVENRPLGGSKTDRNTLDIQLEETLVLAQPATKTIIGPFGFPVGVDAALFDETTVEGRYRKRVAESMAKGEEKQHSVKDDVLRLFRICPNWQNKNAGRFIKFVQALPRGQTLDGFARWWFTEDWRGKKGQPPTLEQIQELWYQAYPQKAAVTADDPNSPERLEAMRARIAEQRAAQRAAANG